MTLILPHHDLIIQWPPYVRPQLSLTLSSVRTPHYDLVNSRSLAVGPAVDLGLCGVHGAGGAQPGGHKLPGL